MSELQKIGRYEIVRELGRGGMATIYLANDPRFQRQVAVKVLPTQFTHDPNFRVRFEREAQTIAGLEHPSIVPVYDFGEENDMPYIVMRYMPGGSLNDRIEQGAIEPKNILPIITRLADALDTTHALGIVHRDLKPDNVLFDQYGNAYLSDFGIVKVAQATSNFTGDSILGTPAYMSPEQVRGHYEVDSRTDIYALGVMIFEMLVGKVPYEGDTAIQQAMKHVTEAVPQLADFGESVPVQFQRAITRSMAKEPDERHPTAGALVADYAAILQGGANAGAAGTVQLSGEAVNETLVNAPSTLPASGGLGGRGDGAAVSAETAPNNRNLFLGIGALALLLAIVGFFIFRPGGEGDDTNITPTSAEIAIVDAETPTPTSEPSATPTPTEEPTETPTPTPSPTPDLRVNFISLAGVADSAVTEILPEFPTGAQAFGDIQFFIENLSKVSTQCEPTSDENLGVLPESILIPTGNIVNPEAVHLLINAGFSVEASDDPKQLGILVFNFEDGEVFEYELVLDANVREWGLPRPDALDSPDLQNAYTGPNRFGDESVIDLLTVALPRSFHDKTLQSIDFRDTSAEIYSSPSPCLFIVGLSVEARN